jgi:hypothetical protein
MEQLLQHIRIKYEMEKDEDLRRTIIELLRYASDAITNLTKEANLAKRNVSKSFMKRIAIQSDGSLKPEDSGWCE